MKGKRKCDFLRLIREEMAEKKAAEEAETSAENSAE